MSNILYIMDPKLFKQLINIDGFTHINGNTYNEHIILTFNNILLDEQKNKIQRAETNEDALKLLSEFNINFTHEY